MRESRWPILAGAWVTCVCAALAVQAASAPRSSSAPAPAATSGKPASVLTGDQVIQILDETVEWYRALGTQQQNASQPSDLLILFANRQTADKVVALAFDMARANAELLSSEASAAAAADHNTASTSLDQKQAQLDSERQSIQQEVATDRQQLATAGKGREQAAAKISELQGELSMIDARRNMLDTMTEFIHSGDPKAANANALKSQIDAIAATVPGAGVSVTAGATTTAAPAGSSTAAPSSASTAAAPLGTTTTTTPSRYGLWDLAVAVAKSHTKLNTIDDITARTKALAATFRKISDAPRAQLQAYSTQGDGLAAQADHADSVALKGLRDQFDTLAWLVQQTSGILLPLGKEQVLLQRYQHNLDSWRVSAEKQYHEAWAALGVRLGIVAGILIVIFVLGEVWRSAVFRYVHEPHRRYQMLLVRTIVVWAVVAIVLGLSFVTEISTFATFAGLLSAGLAVAMQSVLVSVVGYFFLIGKYGIRVGDRIQIGTVVGEVLDIGLVRLHLMELTQQGPLGSTGRVVAFPNLIVFQTTGGLFKQTSGGDVAWHETTLPLPTIADYGVVKQKLLSAISAIVGEYADPKAGAEATPQVNMRLNAGHMEALIRYPLNYKHAAEIDERVAEAVLKVLAQ